MTSHSDEATQPAFIERPAGEQLDCWRCPSWVASFPAIVVRGSTQGICKLHCAVFLIVHSSIFMEQMKSTFLFQTKVTADFGLKVHL
jgi:hypothetical protein